MIPPNKARDTRITLGLNLSEWERFTWGEKKIKKATSNQTDTRLAANPQNPYNCLWSHKAGYHRQPELSSPRDEEPYQTLTGRNRISKGKYHKRKRVGTELKLNLICHRLNRIELNSASVSAPCIQAFLTQQSRV